MIAFEMAVQKGRGCFLNTIVVIIKFNKEDVAIVIILIVFFNVLHYALTYLKKAPNSHVTLLQ